MRPLLDLLSTIVDERGANDCADNHIKRTLPAMQGGMNMQRPKNGNWEAAATPYR